MYYFCRYRMKTRGALISFRRSVCPGIFFFEAKASFFRCSVLEIHQTLLGGLDGWPAWWAYSKHGKHHFSSHWYRAAVEPQGLWMEKCSSWEVNIRFLAVLKLMPKNKWMKMNFSNKMCAGVSWPSSVTLKYIILNIQKGCRILLVYFFIINANFTLINRKI